MSIPANDPSGIRPGPDGAPVHGRNLLQDVSAQAVLQGGIVAVVGYASAVAIAIKGLAAAGATETQIASGLMVLGLAKGLAAIVLSLWSRMPVSTAWTTPGLVFLAGVGAVQGGFPAIVGAFLVVGLLIMLAAFWGPLARLVAAIPRSIANAMLAGILLKLSLAPFVAIRELPLQGAIILLVWLVFLRVARLWAVPAAVAAALIMVAQQGGMPAGFALPHIEWVRPVFTLEAMIGVALPLFVVTMASQNIPGYAVLGTFGYRPSLKQGLGVTGLATAVISVTGAAPVNYAAITAALCAGPDAHPDPARRYVAAMAAGAGFMLLAIISAVAAALVLRASPVLIEAAAGLALIGAFGGAIRAAVEDEAERMPALLTFFTTASGLTIWGIGGAFWGLVLGWAVLKFLSLPARSR